jgi:hypothetical protein
VPVVHIGDARWTSSRMSALGQKQTFELEPAMSALPPKADMRPTARNVR